MKARHLSGDCHLRKSHEVAVATHFCSKVSLDRVNEASPEGQRHRLQPMRVLVHDVSVEGGCDVDDGAVFDDVQRRASQTANGAVGQSCREPVGRLNLLLPCV